MLRLFGAESLEEIFDNLHHDGSDWASEQLETLNKMVRDIRKHMPPFYVRLLSYRLLVFSPESNVAENKFSSV